MSTEEIASIRASLHRIELAIVGDPQVGHKGLAQRMTDNEAKTDAVDKKLLVWGGVVTGVGIALPYLKAKLLG